MQPTNFSIDTDRQARLDFGVRLHLTSGVMGNIVNMRCLLCFLLAAVTLTASAQWYDPGTRTSIPDNEWRQHSDQLGAMLALTSDPKKFVDEWYSTRESHVPRLHTTEKVKRGGIIGALIFFSGCGAGSDTCDATVDFKVLSPDGTVYGEHNGNSVWPQPSVKPTVVLLSQASLQIRIEPSDSLGTYEVLAEFRSPSAKSAFHLKQRFEVIP